MKKSIGVLFASAIILAACSNNDVTEKEIEDVTDTGQVEEAEVEQEETEVENEEVVEIEVDQENEESEEAEPILQEQNESVTGANGEEFPEYAKIAETVDLTDHTTQTVTDNEGERILLFINHDGEKQYKSIFIKHDKRLKIIKLNGGGQIFNERIG